MKTLRSQLLVWGFLLVVLPTVLFSLMLFFYGTLDSRQIRFLFWGSAVASAIAMGVIFWGARRITAPLHQLTAAAKAIREGDFDYKMEDSVLAHGPRETRELSYTFIRMAKNISMQLRSMETANEILAQKEERWQLALRGNKDGIWDWNLLTDEIFLSDRCHEMLGFAPGEGPTTHQAMIESVHSDDRPVLEQKLSAHLIGDEPFFEIEYRRLCKDGSYKWLHDHGQALWNPGGKAIRMAGSLTDITERKQMEEKLYYFSMHDSLTGLYNRAFFEEELQRLNDNRYLPIAVIICDVDGLKLYNDSFGHVLGDRLIQSAAAVLSQTFRSSDIVARIGGDEFAVLLPQITREAVDHALGRLLTAVDKLNASSEGFLLSLSTGMSISQGGSVNLLRMFKEADNNMYREKLQRSQKTRATITKVVTGLLESRDYVAEGHTQRIAEICARLGAGLGWDQDRLDNLRLFAEYHDIGKVGVSETLLFKSGPLSTNEQKEIRRHSEIGHRIALSSPELKPIADFILKHQEWWNGKGYPLGISGEDIPVECRILAIADAYDVIMHERPYKPARRHDEAVREIARCSGSQFDPALVDLFLRLESESLSQNAG